MSKTYTLNSTAIAGGKRNDWDAYWQHMRQNDDGNVVGGESGIDQLKYATYILFNKAELDALRNKTILSITLNITVVSGTIIAAGSEKISVGYKYNDQVAGSSFNDAWARSNAASTALEYSDLAWLESSGAAYTADNTPFAFDLTGTSIPVWGYVIGPTWYTIGVTPRIAANATLVVVTDEDTSYTVSFSANGGTGAPAAQTKTAGVNLTLTSATPTRDGYNFVTWNTEQDGSGTDYSPGGTYSTDASVVLYAQWALKTYTVSYNANGGTGAPSEQTKTHGQTLTLTNSTPTWSGHTFVKWNTAANGTGTDYSSGGSYTANADVVLYAQWQTDSAGLWVKGSDGTMHQGPVYVKGSDGVMHEGTAYIKGSDGQMHIFA